MLLDEIEKAHPDVFNILLQVLDEGRLTDSKGKTVNFKNTIIIMTSNIGSHLIQEKMDILTDVNRDEVMGELKVKLFDLLKSSIRPEFLNRIDEIILFKPLTQKEIRLIVDLQLTNLFRRLEHNQITMTVDNEVKDWLGKLGFDVAFGARPLKRIVQKHLINKLSEKILAAEILPGDKINAVLNVNGEIDFVKVGTKSPS